MSWSAAFAALTQILNTFKTSIIAGIVYMLGKRAGAEDERNKNVQEDLDAVADANRAERDLATDTDSVRDDPFNRDKREG